MSAPLPVPPHLTFHHEAMMTTFSLRLCGKDESLLRSLACECIEMIDELERKLSRYYEGGDVCRMNGMEAGETLHLSEESYECLLVAMEACVHTGGLFDPTLGRMIEHRKSGEDGDLPPLLGQLVVHPDAAAVTCESPGRVIDLGGIGKGFTLDRVGDFLVGWDIESALLSAGASTHLAIGSESWPIDLTGDSHVGRVQLRDEALSASGTSIQGCHIIHPGEARAEEAMNHGIEDRGIYQQSRIWTISRSAALADAWSTALMLMTPDEIAKAPSNDAMLSAIHLEKEDGFHCLLPATENPLSKA